MIENRDNPFKERILSVETELNKKYTFLQEINIEMLNVQEILWKLSNISCEVTSDIEKYKIDLELLLHQQFTNKYNETPKSTIIPYLKFVWNKDGDKYRWNQKRGHKIYIPYLCSNKLTRYGIDYCYPNNEKRYVLLNPECFDECTPTQKILDAFACMGWKYKQFFGQIQDYDGIIGFDE